MLVALYLLSEFYFFCFCLIVSLLGVVFVLFFYKNQFFFLFCLPYLSATSTNTLLLPTPNSIFGSYFFLLGNVTLLVFPILLLGCGFFFCITVFRNSSFTACLKKILKFIFFFVFLVINVFTTLVNCFFYLVEALNSSTHYVMRFVFDFSMDSWLLFSLVVYLCLFFFIFFIFLLVYFVRYVLNRGAILFLRSVFMVFSLVFLTVIVPNEPFLHAGFFIITILVLECVVAFAFLQKNYCGRVA
jgi:hypothetical protein